jgi:KUP system potassium uptake protein
MKSGQHIHRFTGAGILITIGIIFGDIGTSPLYVLRAIVGTHAISSELVLGAVSCIFWTLTLQTTVKYIVITLRADNKGEGGIFSLYALLRRYRSRFLSVAAMLGGSALLADGMITPPISIASAIEGLHNLNHQIPVIPIVIIIIAGLFFIQQFGTGFVGRSFGPIMVIWFLMIALLGFASLVQNPAILYALNPKYALQLLTQYPGGFWLLGGVFLCTTGAEALYSDLGHCGRENIRVSWIFVKSSLLLNYFGQGAWLISESGLTLGERNPFYEIMPGWFVLVGVIISTFAAIVASQALISGSFTLINEAIRLNFLTRLRIIYPSNIRGQIYIPAVNWLLMMGCIGVVLYFKESSNMEAAYGMAIILTMMVTTILMIWYLKMKHYPVLFIGLFILVYGTIESSFLISNISKLTSGGWITLIMSAFIFLLMFSWNEGRKIRNRYVEFTNIRDYLNTISELRQDDSIPKTSTHLVYLTSANYDNEIENSIIYSIFQKRPKRADVYWLLHVDVTDDPYRMEYRVNHLINGEVIKIDFRIGFRIEPRINLFFRQVVAEMKLNGEVDVVSRYTSLNKQNLIGDFRFVVIEKFLSYDNVIPLYEKLVLSIYNILKRMGLSDEKAFGLDTSNVLIEKVPIVINPPSAIKLIRV